MNFVQKRMELTCEILRNNLPSSCTFVEPIGGYFIWIELPKNAIASEANSYCRDNYKVFGLPSEIFAPAKNVNNCLRLSIGFQECDVLKVALVELCKGLKEFIANLK